VQFSGGVFRPGVVTLQARRDPDMSGAMATTVPASGRGRQATTLSIGDVRVQLTSSDHDVALDIPPVMTPFVCDRDHADARVEARVDVIEPAASPLAFDSGGVWMLRRSADELVFEFRSPRFGSAPYKIARFRPDFSTGEVVLHRQYFPTAPSFYPLEYPLDELIFTNLLSRRNGVELHGCGVADGDEGLLFLGYSGAGKSTLARLWRRQPGATILSDDRIILRLRGGHVMMHGTPWHGDEALVAKGPVPLSRVFVLHQGPECIMRALVGAEAAASIFARCFAPFHSGDAIAGTLETLEQIVGLLPCADLWFTPDDAAIEFVRASR
jgi:hypothetical protein